jgi:hypothetical protein
MSQPAFNQQKPQHPAYPSVQQNNSLEFMQGTKYKEKSLIFGFVGFFILGIVFGPLAIMNASKAEAMHHSATLGKVLGWVDTIAGILWIVVFVIMIIAGMSSSASRY